MFAALSQVELSALSGYARWHLGHTFNFIHFSRFPHAVALITIGIAPAMLGTRTNAAHYDPE